MVASTAPLRADRTARLLLAVSAIVLAVFCACSVDESITVARMPRIESALGPTSEPMLQPTFEPLLRRGPLPEWRASMALADTTWGGIKRKFLVEPHPDSCGGSNW